MKEKGAQHEIAQGMPQIATRKVAKRSDRAKGAKIIVQPNMTCDINQAVCKSGRKVITLLSSVAMPGGGRGLKVGLLWSGGRTQKGRSTELMKVMKEKITRERLPRRPTSPRVSLE
jgi:hypothetical protein